MKKQLNTHGVMNELKGGSHFFVASEEAQHPSTNIPLDREMPTVEMQPSSDPLIDQSIEQLTDPPTEQSTKQPTRQSTAQSANKSTTPLTGQTIDRSPILGRPKAFYITEKQDQDLDLAVTKFSQHAADKVGQKIDRSTVLRLLLEGADLTNDQTIERLTDQLVSRLIRQLTG